MLAEVLLVLAGHPSSFFVPSPAHRPTSLTLSQDLQAYLHPGEITSLNQLADLAFRYTRVRTWAQDIQRRGRDSILQENRKGKNKDVEPDSASRIPDVYLCTLASGVLEVLREYELLIVETEVKILSMDPVLVQDQQGYVPLSTLVATFSSWQTPLFALCNLVDTLSTSLNGVWTPGRLIDELYTRSRSGNPLLGSIFATLLGGLRTLFLTHTIAFLLYGYAPTSSSPTNPAIGLDIGSDPLSPQHRSYVLNDDLLPKGIGYTTRESLLYVGRVAATLRREGRDLPNGLRDELREDISNVRGLYEGGDLDQAIARARADVGEWLWKHILTGSQIIEALETFGNYFLARNTDYVISLIREIHKLRLDKLITSNPHSSSSIIRETDLNLALLRSSVGTSAENDRTIEKLRFKLERGPIRPLIPSLSASRSKRSEEKDNHNPNTSSSRVDRSIRDLFSSTLLGSPIVLEATISWPLDLFMTPPARAIYSDINAYLLALRHTHLRVLECWTSLSSSQRQRRKWTGANEGGTPEEVVQRRNLAREGWGIIKMMLFFLEELQNHFMMDIIDVQHRRLVDSLDIEQSTGLPRTISNPGSLRSSVKNPSERFRGSVNVKDVDFRAGSPGPDSTIFDTHTVRSRVPPSLNKHTTYLDFLTLRQMHSRHLSFLREGLLIADKELAILIKDLLDVCTGFTGLVEKWGGDVLPELLEDSSEDELGDLVRERTKAIRAIKEEFHDLLSDFFRALVESQNPQIGNGGDTSRTSTASASAGGISFSRTAKAAQMIASSRMVSRQVSSSNIPGVGGGKSGNKEKEERALEADALMGRHVEQLLLRLDFNGVLTSWLEDEGQVPKDVLAEGGL